MSLLQEMPDQPLHEPDVERRSRSVRNHVQIPILVCLLGFLSSCLVLKRVGQYPVTGTVVDWCTGAPVEGATVFLRYTGVNFLSGPAWVDGEPVLTNELGKFYIPAKKMTLASGSGGLAGEIREWPDVVLRTSGYGEISIERIPQTGKPLTSPQDYEAMTLEIGKVGKECTSAGWQPPERAKALPMSPRLIP